MLKFSILIFSGLFLYHNASSTDIRFVIFRVKFELSVF